MPAATTTSRDLKTRSGAISRGKSGKSANRRGHRLGRIMREGDEEIVREARSDDGSSQGDFTDEEDSASQSSVNSLPESRLQSSSRSDQRPDLSNGHTSTTSEPSEPGPSSGPSFLDALRAARLDWSDTVQESEGDIQVVQFDKMDDLNVDEVGNEPEDDKSMSRSSQRGRGQPFNRPVGMSARQVYLKRLESDPAYIPRVGEFWGHDERLLEKDLRSLSGWWRGKWTGRGGFGSRGGSRGRFGSHPRGSTHDPSEGDATTPNQSRSDPVEQTWKHDGFEELNKVEEVSNRSKAPLEGRERSGSWVSGRGRGRGAVASPVQSRNVRSQSFASPQEKQHPHRSFGHGRAQSMSWNRYEYAWTKHSVTFLFQDGLTKARTGDEVAIRVRLPGQARYNIVRVSNLPRSDGDTTNSGADAAPHRTIVVRLPKTATRSSDLENARTIASPSISEEAPPAGLKVEPQDVSVSPSTAQTITASSVALSTPVTETDSATKPLRTPITEAQQADQGEQAPEKSQSDAKITGAPPTIQLITNFASATPSPAYSSPTYGPGYHYPLPRPAHSFSANGATMGETPVWFDPRMPYGYPTPPPLPGHMYTPPPGPVHHVHHHSHSTPHPHNYPHVPQITPYYPTSSLAMPEYQQMQPVPPLVSPQQAVERQPPTFAYSADGAMIDPQTGAPIFSPAKPATKVAIRKPNVAVGDASALTGNPPDANMNGGASGVPVNVGGSGQKEVRSQIPVHYPLSQFDMATPPGAGFTPNQLPSSMHPAFWNAYPPPQGGYYYLPQGYGMPSHDYSLGHQFQPHPHMYPQAPQPDPDFQQPPVYY
ncbi:hypothetical protein FRC17_009625 [Serendipita sp. 399]|nr:hypothetical protein FRC17_009625 [Serendipita sp. 399]